MIIKNKIRINLLHFFEKNLEKEKVILFNAIFFLKKKHGFQGNLFIFEIYQTESIPKNLNIDLSK